MTKKKDDGGSADQSMTLRDYFAAKAMYGSIAGTPSHIEIDESVLALWCYKMADAMLEARKQ